MLAWSTKDVPERERFSYWRETLARNIFGITPELEREQHARFHGEASAFRVADASLLNFSASQQRVSRSRADVERTPTDNLCIYRPLAGTACIVSNAGQEFVTTRTLVGYSDLPYESVPATQEGYQTLAIKIPLARCGPLTGHPRNLVTRPLVAGSSLEVLLSSYLQAFVAQAPHLHGAAAEVAVSTLAQLACAARGIASPGEEPTRDAISAGRLQAARQFIERNLHRGELTPAHAAQMLGMSLRNLHLLFEPTGTSFARYLLNRRLERARMLLLQPPYRGIAEVGFACGFESLTTFYRNFQRANGTSPGDYRTQRLAEHGAGAILPDSSHQLHAEPIPS
jgi:AraC-like DNA-binding protein